MSSSHLIENGTIVDGTGAAARPGAVLVRGDKIVAVGDEATRSASGDVTKIDAPSIPDPEAWFGTREVVVEDGAPKTVITDSAFVSAIQRPGVLIIDEFNRATDHTRGIVLGLLDDSRAVTNPLTGQPLVRHPQCFVIMTGNVGLAFTGTYAVDPAFLTRALVTNFDYLDRTSETALLISRTGVDQDAAALLARFADESRQRAARDEETTPVSTREILLAADAVSVGLDVDTAVRQAIINALPSEGGAESPRAKAEMSWTTLRKRVSEEADAY